MGFPTLDFNGTEGQRSTGLGGPDTLEGDLREISKMFDPGSLLKSGLPGGIGSENMKDGAVEWDNLSDDLKSRSGGVGTVYKNGTGTFPPGTSCTVTDAFITASTLVFISPDDTLKQGTWEPTSYAGYFTITSNTAETSSVSFDWGAIR